MSMLLIPRRARFGAAALCALLAMLPAGGAAQSSNPFTAGIDGCNNAGVQPPVPRLASYNATTGEVDLPLVFAPGLGWYRAKLDLVGAPARFRLREVAPTCEAHPAPATYLNGEVYIPEIEAFGPQGSLGKYDATLNFEAASGHFVATRVWDFSPGVPSVPSARMSAQRARAADTLVQGVQLAQSTGPYAAGDRIPLSRIQGGHIAQADACPERHLHGTITIDASGPYADPNSTECGHGVIVTVDANAPTSVVPATVPPGTEYCGPDITEVFFARLKLMAQRLAALPDDEKGIFDGTVFLARNGQNMDFAVGAIRNPQGNPICPTPACSGTGHTSTFTLCGRCMVSHIDNDIEYGFVARSLGVPWSVQLTGGQAWDFWQRGSYDPTWSNAAYWFGNHLADAIDSNPNATSAELCALLDVRLRIGLVFLPKVSEIIAAGLADFGKSNCTPCPYGCPEALIQIDFAKRAWDLDDGKKAQPPP